MPVALVTCLCANPVTAAILAVGCAAAIIIQATKD
ncbi:MAG: hypothetical protein RL122_1907 [Pseudomonadota bacterium]|jgi:hypothetical protein